MEVVAIDPLCGSIRPRHYATNGRSLEFVSEHEKPMSCVLRRSSMGRRRSPESLGEYTQLPAAVTTTPAVQRPLSFDLIKAAVTIGWATASRAEQMPKPFG
jgi:hypothetical protein